MLIEKKCGNENCGKIFEVVPQHFKRRKLCNECQAEKNNAYHRKRSKEKHAAKMKEKYGNKIVKRGQPKKNVSGNEVVAKDNKNQE